MANTREPPGVAGPSIINLELQQNEVRSVTLTFWTWTEDNGWQKLSLTGKTVEFRVKLVGGSTWTIWDTATNGGMTLAADQTANKGEADVAFTVAKVTGTPGTYDLEGWNATTGEETKHLTGMLKIAESGGPV